MQNKGQNFFSLFCASNVKRWSNFSQGQKKIVFPLLKILALFWSCFIAVLFCILDLVVIGFLKISQTFHKSLKGSIPTDCQAITRHELCHFYHHYINLKLLKEQRKQSSGFLEVSQDILEILGMQLRLPVNQVELLEQGFHKREIFMTFEVHYHTGLQILIGKNIEALIFQLLQVELEMQSKYVLLPEA